MIPIAAARRGAFLKTVDTIRSYLIQKDLALVYYLWIWTRGEV